MRLASITVMMGWVALVACQDESPSFTERPFGADELPGAQQQENADGKPARGLRWEETFEAHRIQDASLHINVPDALVHENLALTHVFTDKAKTMRQITRAVGQDAFKQGYPGGTLDEAFTQTGNKNLDILVVVDNSGSMEEEQRNLATRLAPLLSEVEETEWRIAVTTTDPSGPCVRAVISKGDRNAEAAFRAAVQAGTSGSGNERGILTAVKALGESCSAFTNWTRADSSLAVLLLSDEDNCSDGGDCRFEPYAKSRYLLDHLATMRVPGKNARVYGILWHPTQDQDECPTAAQPARIYAELIASTGGSWGSICDADYTPTLAAISRDMAVNLATKFTLKKAPTAGSVSVTVDGVARTDFSVAGNVLEFDDAPRDGSVVKVSYGFGGEPMKSTFVLSQAAAPDSLAVTADGVPVLSQDYALDATHTRLVFSAPPGERANVKVSYRADAALQATFALEKGFKQDALVVRVNGQPVTDVVADSVAGTFTFRVPPADSAQIHAAFKMPQRPVTRYPVAMPQQVADSLEARDAATGAALSVRYENGAVIFPASAIVEGRAVTLSYTNPHRDQFRYTLPQEPIAGTLEVTDGDTVCRDALVREGAEIFAGNCGFPWDVAEVDARYRFVAETLEAFTVRVPELGKEDTQKWSVWVDGKPFTAFTQNADTVRLTDAVPVGSQVTIRVDY